MISIYGQNLASVVSPPPTVPLPTAMNGTQVSFGHMLAPLFYVSPTQINAQIPFELDPSKQYYVFVSANGKVTAAQSITLSQAIPALATYMDGTLEAVHLDYSDITAASPAQPGETIVMFLVGMGPPTGAVASGAGSPGHSDAAGLNASAYLRRQPRVLCIRGFSPTAVGLYQMTLDTARHPRRQPRGGCFTERYL